MLFVFTASLIFLPLDLVLNLENYPFTGFSPFVCALDFACIFDILLHFITGYDEIKTKEVILDPKKIAKKYVFSSYFTLDVISSIPSELIAYVVEIAGFKTIHTKYIKCFSLVKIVRLRTCTIYVGRTGDVRI